MALTRRQFFGMTAGALIAAGLPLALLPEKTIVLPPKSGWYPDLRMREVEQYVVNTDSLVTRYDMAWMKGDERIQWYVDFSSDQWPRIDLNRDAVREIARSKFAEIVAKHNLQSAKTIQLPLPRGTYCCYT